VTSGTHILVLKLNGSVAPGWPGYRSASFSGPAAIGDVDGDGTNEVVTLFGPYMNIQSPTGATKHFSNLIGLGKTYVATPSLADLDLDGFLEIVAPTQQGDVYVYRWDASYQPGFPWHDAAVNPYTTAALANIWSTGEPEIAVSEQFATLPHVHLFDHNGVPVGSWPCATEPGGVPAAPIMDVVDRALRTYTVMTGSSDEYAWGWSNFGNRLEGWPKDLGAPVLVSPASGDIDADGRLEVVMLTSSPAQMHIVDLGSAVYRDALMPRSWWPMYGYNSERQSCLACAPYAVTSAPHDPNLPARLRFEAPSPNPMHESVSLRFALPARAAVRLDILDVSGRLVRPLLRTELDAGPHGLAWDGRTAGNERAATGVYYVRLMCTSPAGEEAQVRRVVLAR
jgi:hypothetical protein